MVFFNARLYNGMDKAIEEITVSISGEKINPPQEYKLLLENQNPIEPKSSATAGNSLQTLPGNNFKWHIISVKVCE